MAPPLRPALLALADGFVSAVIEAVLGASLAELAELDTLGRAHNGSRVSGPDGSAVVGPKAGPDALRPLLQRLRELYAQLSDARTRYLIGETIAEIKAHPGRYGVGGVATAAAMLGEDFASLYRFAAVAETWSADEVTALVGRGSGLTWSHLVLLGAVRPRQARDRLVQRALVERLSVRQLAPLVSAASPPERERRRPLTLVGRRDHHRPDGRRERRKRAGEGP